MKFSQIIWYLRAIFITLPLINNLGGAAAPAPQSNEMPEQGDNADLIWKLNFFKISQIGPHFEVSIFHRNLNPRRIDTTRRKTYSIAF